MPVSAVDRELNHAKDILGDDDTKGLLKDELTKIKGTVRNLDSLPQLRDTSIRVRNVTTNLTSESRAKLINELIKYAPNSAKSDLKRYLADLMGIKLRA